LKAPAAVAPERRYGPPPLLFHLFSKLFHLHERRNRTIQGVGDGAEQFGFGFRHHAVGATV